MSWEIKFSMKDFIAWQGKFVKEFQYGFSSALLSVIFHINNIFCNQQYLAHAAGMQEKSNNSKRIKWNNWQNSYVAIGK